MIMQTMLMLPAHVKHHSANKFIIFNFRSLTNIRRELNIGFTHVYSLLLFVYQTFFTSKSRLGC